MKKGTLTKIRITDGYGDEKTLSASFLGKGSFAVCHSYDGYVYSYVKTREGENDYSKEAIALWADSENPYIPEFEKIGDYENSISDYGILYKSPLYRPLNAKSKEAWKLYKKINDAWKKTGWKTVESDYEFNSRFLDNVRNDNNIPAELLEALESINDACSNYGSSYRFEFPKRNLAVDEKGNLILLDVIFNTAAMREIRNNK